MGKKPELEEGVSVLLIGQVKSKSEHRPWNLRDGPLPHHGLSLGLNLEERCNHFSPRPWRNLVLWLHLVALIILCCNFVFVRFIHFDTALDQESAN